MNIFYYFYSKVETFKMISYKGNKKAANRKGLAAHDRSVSYFFYGLYIYMAEELLNWLSLWPPNFVSSLFSLHSIYFQGFSVG